MMLASLHNRQQVGLAQLEKIMEAQQNALNQRPKIELTLLCQNLATHFQGQPASVTDQSLKSFILAMGTNSFSLPLALKELKKTCSFPRRESETRLIHPKYPDLNLESKLVLSGREITVGEIIEALCSSDYNPNLKDCPRTQLVEKLKTKSSSFSASQTTDSFWRESFSRDR